jgi:hypothetical protein
VIGPHVRELVAVLMVGRPLKILGHAFYIVQVLLQKLLGWTDGRQMLELVR